MKVWVILLLPFFLGLAAHIQADDFQSLSPLDILSENSFPSQSPNVPQKKNPLEVTWTPVPNAYIVTLDPAHQRVQANNHHIQVLDWMSRLGGKVMQIFHHPAGLSGYALYTKSKEFLENLRNSTEVLNIEPEYHVRLPGGALFDEAEFVARVESISECPMQSHVDGRIQYPSPSSNSLFIQEMLRNTTTQTNAPWGLARLSSSAPLKDGDKSTAAYTYPTVTDFQTTVYVLDTGIKIMEDFLGNAFMGPNFTPDSNEDDGHGHGTHCAGTVGGHLYGVAKGTKIVGVKVLTNRGFGFTSGIIKGLEWVLHKAAETARKTPVVVSMSLGGGKQQALEQAVNALVDANIGVVVAAGNSNRDACDYSPAGAEKAFTVAASCADDVFAYFSNWGKCVDVIAPGCNVESLDIFNPGKPRKMSGTSMACPHVAGLYVLTAKALGLTDVQDIYQVLRTNALNGTINSTPATTPNLLSSVLPLIQTKGIKTYQLPEDHRIPYSVRY